MIIILPSHGIFGISEEEGPFLCSHWFLDPGPPQTRAPRPCGGCPPHLCWAHATEAVVCTALFFSRVKVYYGKARITYSE